MIRMKHAQHGFHMASSLEEVDMRKNGWVEDVPEPEAPPQAAPVEMSEKRQSTRKANK